jgi:hypothetical protein
MSIVNIGYGVQRLIDAQQRYTQNSRMPVLLRLRNFSSQQSQLYAQLGYVLTPSAGTAGFIDVPIQPPPSMRMVSQHNIGMSAGKLRFGARDYIVTGSFVQAQQSALGLARPELVWIGAQTVGIVADNQLFSIEQYVHEEIGGMSVVWTLTCNANELK